MEKNAGTFWVGGGKLAEREQMVYPPKGHRQKRGKTGKRIVGPRWGDSQKTGIDIRRRGGFC